MHCTVLADGEPVGHVDLAFEPPPSHLPITLIGRGTLVALPSFAAARAALEAPPPPLAPFRQTGGASPRAIHFAQRGPAFTLHDVRGALLPTRAVRCAPVAASAGAYEVIAYFDEAGMPEGAWPHPAPRQADTHAPASDGDG